MQEYLTNEHLKKEHINSFALVNYAIKQAKDMMASGRPCRVSTHIQNQAYQVLLEVALHRDQEPLLEDDDDELS